MNTEQFKNLLPGDVVFYVNQRGMYPINEFQYLGTIKNNFKSKQHYEKPEYHVFLSRHFVSTACIPVGDEKRSRTIPLMFTEYADAQNKLKEIIDAENSEEDDEE